MKPPGPDEPTAWYAEAPLLSQKWQRLLARSSRRWRALPLVGPVTPPGDLRPIERAASELPLYDGWIAADPWAADALLERTGGALPARLETYCLGDAARRLVESYEIVPHFVAPSTRALADELRTRVGRQERLLAPRGPFELIGVDELGALGAEIVRPTAYTLPQGAGSTTAPQAGDTVLFFDAASVEAWGRRADRPEIEAVAGDPFVASRLRAHGMKPSSWAAGRDS